ncbi:hypothetical protein PQX77_013480 [Marasmius sp. AFHP31]|nr:hypothetical protein PQX77_013480 [Marasmius sp. AFHP31]
MVTTASLDELADAVIQTPFSPSKGFLDSYLAPLGNNPHKSTNPGDETTVHVFTDKHNKPAEVLMFLYTNKQPTITNRRGYTLLGEYFNLWMDSNTTSFAEDKLRGTRASICCDFITPEFTDMPPGVVRNSVNSMKMLMKLQDETENRFNRFAPVSALNSSLVRPSITGQDAVVTVLNTPRLFNCDHVKLANIKPDTDFDKDPIPPSVMKRSAAQAKALSLGINNPLWLDDLPDSRGFYSASMDHHNARNCIFVVEPRVYDVDGKFVNVTSYDATIGDRQLVLAHCHLKMWHFEPNKQRNVGNHSRTYHVVINTLHLLRSSPDERKRELINSLKGLCLENAAESSAASTSTIAREPGPLASGGTSKAISSSGPTASAAVAVDGVAAPKPFVSRDSTDAGEQVTVTEIPAAAMSSSKHNHAAGGVAKSTESQPDVKVAVVPSDVDLNSACSSDSKEDSGPVSSFEGQTTPGFPLNVAAEGSDPCGPSRKRRSRSNGNGAQALQEEMSLPVKRLGDPPVSGVKAKQSRHN